MRAFSMDLRERVLVAIEGGETSITIATRFSVSDSWVRKLKRLNLRTGSIEPKKHPGRARLLDSKAEQAIEEMLATSNDVTLSELQTQLEERTTLRASITTLCRTLQRLGFRRKKRSFTRASSRPHESSSLAPNIERLT